MEFKEFKNAAYWQELRNSKQGQVSLAQLAGMIIAGTMFFALLYLAIIVEG